MRLLSRLGLALVMPFVSLGVLTVNAETAQAANCYLSVNAHNAGWDSVIGGRVIRNGPSTSCGVVGRGSGNLKWDLLCWDFSSSGNVWWRGRGPDGNGWVIESNLVRNNNVRSFSNKCTTV